MLILFFGGPRAATVMKRVINKKTLRCVSSRVMIVKWRPEAVMKQEPSGASRRTREEKEKGKVFYEEDSCKFIGSGHVRPGHGGRDGQLA